MIKNNKKMLVITAVVTVLPIIIGLILWSRLPAQMATHWGPDGNADGYSSKAFAVFGLPLIMLAVHLLCVIFTSLDPKNKNQNNKVNVLVMWLCPVISLIVNGASYATALGKNIDVTMIVFLLLGVTFVIIGNYLPKCKQNYTIGIKVIWALDNEENWNATHRVSGKLWVAGGIIMILAAFLPVSVSVWINIPVTLLLAVVPVIYSYLYYKNNK